jgi:regulator of replication initiation timing
MTCPHAYHDQEASISTDGLCPLCLLADNERLTATCKGWYDQNVNLIEQRDKVWEENKSLRSDNERLRALLLRHQVAAWCEEDSDLAVETRRALETKP